MGRLGRKTAGIAATVLAAAASLFAALAVPDSDATVHSPSAESSARAFSWNRDAYWQSLEVAYRDLRRRGCMDADARLAGSFKAARSLVQRIERSEIGPGASVFADLERLVFELGPFVGACGARFQEYVQLAAEIRRTVKRRSADWDMSMEEARTTLYRILYGSRAALEEVMLQAPAGVAPTVREGVAEPSQAPSALILGVRVHSGDILVSRGGAPTSALIARGSDYPGNFSHVALVYVDPGTRVAHAVEAHIERGVVVSSVDDYIRDKKLRIMLVRLRSDLPRLREDPLLPHKAAEHAYRRATRERVAYDFEMDYRDHTRLFCSEVASAAYERVGVDLWMGISRISSPGLRRWLAGFGVRHFETQEPSDLEYDPQLSVVLEWHDPETLRKDRYDNAATDVMLEGAERGEDLRYRWYLLPPARITKIYSAARNLGGRIGPIPEGMSASAALRNKEYSSRHAAIAARLGGKAAQFRRDSGYEPPYWELIRLARAAKLEIEGGA